MSILPLHLYLSSISGRAGTRAPPSGGHLNFKGEHKSHCVGVCVWGALASVADAKACNRFLMCAVLSVSLSLSKSITFSKEGRG